MEYNLGIPSGSGQTTINVWLVYDLMRQRWFEKVPATYPQTAFPVQDSEGTRYLYGSLDGYLMRLEYGYSWDGTLITYLFKTADQLPAGGLWYKTLIRRFKILSQMPDLDEGEYVTISIKHYSDGEQTRYTSLDDFVIRPENYLKRYYLVDHDGNYIVDHAGNYVVTEVQRDLRYVRDTQECNLEAYSHQWEISVVSNDYEFIENMGKRLLGYSYLARVRREDLVNEN